MVARQKRDLHEVEPAVGKDARHDEHDSRRHALPAHVHADELPRLAWIRLQHRRHDARANQRAVLHDREELHTAEQQRDKERQRKKKAPQPAHGDKAQDQDIEQHPAEQEDRIRHEHPELIPLVHVDVEPRDWRKVQEIQNEQQPRLMLHHMRPARPSPEHEPFPSTQNSQLPAKMI